MLQVQSVWAYREILPSSGGTPQVQSSKVKDERLGSSGESDVKHRTCVR